MMHCITVLKFKKFSLTQILREFNFGYFRSSKKALLSVKFHKFSITQILREINLGILKVLKVQTQHFYVITHLEP